jgi:hypothetical protein
MRSEELTMYCTADPAVGPPTARSSLSSLTEIATTPARTRLHAALVGAIPPQTTSRHGVATRGGDVAAAGAVPRWLPRRPKPKCEEKCRCCQLPPVASM